MSATLTRLWRDKLDVVFPRGCVHCQGLVEQSSFRHLCGLCETQLLIVKPPYCSTCGHPYFRETEINRCCQHCEELEPDFPKAKGRFS